MKQGSYAEFLQGVADRESSGRYNIVNGGGFMGKYQLGLSALVDAGYYKNGKFIGTDGVYSREDFLRNPQAQENAMYKFSKKQWDYMMSKGLDKYFGTKINGIVMTPAAYIAGAHLCGHGAVIDYVKSGGKKISYDGNGVSVEEYMRELNNYDVTPITGTFKKATPKTHGYNPNAQSPALDFSKASGEITNYCLKAPDINTKNSLLQQCPLPPKIERKNSSAAGMSQGSLNNKQNQAQQSPVSSFSMPNVPVYYDVNGNVIYSNVDINDFTNEELEKIINPRKRILYGNELGDLLKVGNKDYLRAYYHTVYNNPQKYTRGQLNQMVQNGQMIYVQSYMRSDGTPVEGYYRRYPEKD